MAATTAPRLSLVFAREASVAVILRRGPAKYVLVTRWDTARDTFERGAWFYGRIYGEKCGLSPNGELFVYFVHVVKQNQNKAYTDAYTAVSRPPWLTALALWPLGTTYGGGGVFVDDHTLRLGLGSGAWDRTGGEEGMVLYSGFAHHPAHPPSGLRIDPEFRAYSPDTGFADLVPEDGWDWTGHDHSGRRIGLRSGAIHAIEGGEPRLLMDFTGDVPTRTCSPGWARVWPPPPPQEHRRTR